MVQTQKLIAEEGKLRTYLKIKCNFGYEKYLDMIKEFNKRKCFAKFRVSNHKLQIELGRYTKPLTPSDLRLCDKCDLNKVEDEVHCFTECPKFATDRDSLFSIVKKYNNNFENLSAFDKLFWCFTCENSEIVQQLSCFLQECNIT